MTERTHFVYRAFDEDGRLLYIGCTKNLKERAAGHRADLRWFQDATRFHVAGPYPRERALDIEKTAIKAERPLHNYMHLKQSWMQRREGWIKRETKRLLNTEGWDGTTVDFYRLYDKATDHFREQEPIGRPDWETA